MPNLFVLFKLLACFVGQWAWLLFDVVAALSTDVALVALILFHPVVQVTQLCELISEET